MIKSKIQLLGKKSKRVNLLIRPETHKLASDECAKLGISLNEAINQLLESWIIDRFAGQSKEAFQLSDEEGMLIATFFKKEDAEDYLNYLSTIDKNCSIL